MNIQAVEKSALPEPQDIIIETQNGRRIGARIFRASHASSVVIIAGAMGVAQHCYEKFAKFLNDNGHHAITFDYYGYGQSIHKHVKHCDTDILEWGQQDCHAVIQYAKNHFDHVPVQWIGHSVGGQLMGMTPNFNQITNAVTVACGSGYWRENSPPTKRIVWLVWYFLTPALVPVLGYFPGKKLNIVGNLPGRVMWQWRRWALNKDYAVGAEGEAMQSQFDSVTVPITSLSFSDDEMMSKENIDSLHSFYRGSDVTMIRVTAEQLGERFVGHLGWFREKFKDSIWAGQILPLLER